MVKMILDFYKKKKIFITGHTGFKGTWLSQILLRSGAELTGFALEPSSSPSLFVQTKIEKDMHSLIGDIRDKESLIKAVKEAKPDIIFHLAAQPIVRISYRNPAITYETNVIGTLNILEALRLTSSVISFVNVTTDKVYENKEWFWGYRENENLCGLDPYSNSKSCSELITYSYRNSFFSDANSASISTARSGNVIGGGDYSEDRIIPDCVRAANEKKEILVRNPDSIRPYQHVLECLSGYLLLAEKQYKNKYYEGAYNFGPDNENCVTTEQLVELFCFSWGNNSAWRVQGNNGPHEANFLKLDCSKAKAVLNWCPRWNIKYCVDKVVEFEKCTTDNEKTICLTKQIGEYFCDNSITQ